MLEADPERLRRAARRLLVRRFGSLEAARLLAEPLVPLRRRGRRRAA